MILILCSSGACLVLGMSGRKNSLRSGLLDDFINAPLGPSPCARSCFTVELGGRFDPR